MQESCYLRGVRGLAPASSAASRMHSRTGGAHTRRYIHKAVHTKGVFFVSRGPEEVSRGTPQPPGGGGVNRGGGGVKLSWAIYIYVCVCVCVCVCVYANTHFGIIRGQTGQPRAQTS